MMLDTSSHDSWSKALVRKRYLPTTPWATTISKQQSKIAILPPSSTRHTMIFDLPSNPISKRSCKVLRPSSEKHPIGVVVLVTPSLSLLTLSREMRATRRRQLATTWWALSRDVWLESTGWASSTWRASECLRILTKLKKCWFKQQKWEMVSQTSSSSHCIALWKARKILSRRTSRLSKLCIAASLSSSNFTATSRRTLKRSLPFSARSVPLPRQWTEPIKARWSIYTKPWSMNSKMVSWPP